MTREELAAALAQDLESLLDGRLEANEFWSRYDEHQDSALLDAIGQNLDHYLADADVRARDADYAAMQNAEMRKLIALLGEGASDFDLAKINFLGYSGG